VCTPYGASKPDQQLAKCDHSSIVPKNNSIFLRDGDISTFKRPNYCISSAEQCARRMEPRNQTNNSQNANIRCFCRNMTVIFLPIEIFRRLNAQITAFDAQNIVHDILSLETRPGTRTMRTFVDFVEKCQ
jgi:hypothetical protein